MDLANELAATRLPEAIDSLEEGDAKPIWHLIGNLRHHS
jgi:hypothetical protein